MFTRRPSFVCCLSRRPYLHDFQAQGVDRMVKTNSSSAKTPMRRVGIVVGPRFLAQKSLSAHSGLNAKVS